MGFAIFMSGHNVGQLLPKGCEPGGSVLGCLGRICPTPQPGSRASRGSEAASAPGTGHLHGDEDSLRPGQDISPQIRSRSAGSNTTMW